MNNQEQIRGLVLRAVQGEQDAFQELYLITRQKAYFTAISITKNEADAQDILQESYLKAYQSLAQLENPALFTSWLNQIAANKAKNYISKRKPDSFADYGDDNAMYWQEETDTSFLPDERLDQKESKALIMKLVSDLPEDQRLVVLMHYYNDMEVADMAKALEVPEGTVKSRLSRARQKLLATLKDAQSKGLKLYSALPIPFLVYFIKMIGFEESSADRLPPLVLGSAASGAAAAVAATLSSSIKQAVNSAIKAVKTASAPMKAVVASATGVIAVAGAIAGVSVYHNGREAIEMTEPSATHEVNDSPTTTVYFELQTGMEEPPALPQITEHTEQNQAQTTGRTVHTTTRTTATRPPSTSVTQVQTTSVAAKTTTVRSKFSWPTNTDPIVWPTWPTTKEKTTTMTTTRTTPTTTTTTTIVLPPIVTTTTTTATTTTTTAPPAALGFELNTAGWIIKYNGTAMDLVIPSVIDGISIHHLSSRAFFGLGLTSVVIPQGVHCIQSKTFGDCAQLQTVAIPPSVTSIRDDAFEGCSPSLIIICETGSNAHNFALSKGYAVQLTTFMVHP